MLMQEFSRRLQALRERRRISRRVLSELCGLSSDAVRRYERGEAEPTLTSLLALADFFEISLDELVGEKK
jgi:transcriptional regulator with XRE-family HTH domain